MEENNVLPSEMEAEQVEAQPITEPQEEVSETPAEAPVEAPVETQVETPVDETETVEYWKKRATEQAQENIILNSKVKDTRRELTNQPAETELRQAFPDWEYMEPWQREAAKRAFNAEKLARDLATEREAEREKQRWNADLEVAIAKNPTLQGKEQAFKDFASKPTRRGVPMEVLTAAFLYEAGKTPAPKSSRPAALETASGGPRGSVAPKPLSGTDLANLRKTNEKAWLEYIQTHDIEV